MAITNGRYRGKLCGIVVLGTSSQKKTPFIEVYGEITQGVNAGGRARWTGYFGPNSSERTVEALQAAGWEGEDLGEFADGELHGLDKNEVELVIEIEEYEVTNEDESVEKRSAPRIQFINSLLRSPNLQNAMPKEDAASFGDKMRGLVLKMKSKKPTGGDGTDFNHGENEKPAEEQKKAAGGKKGW